MDFSRSLSLALNLAFLVTASCLAACGSDDSSSGSSATSGSGSTGGTPLAGGATASGVNTGGASGGSVNTGGASGSILNTGGAAGGSVNTGGAAGGSVNTGGATGSELHTGGSVNTGGATGGTINAGGTAGTGGTLSTGGATGGAIGSGGSAAATGGSSASGGSSEASGGQPPTGGTGVEVTTGGTGADGGTGGQPATGGASGGGGFEGTMRIMPIGDSITRATCWRAELWQQLSQAHASRFDFVGTLTSNPGCNVSGFDEDNQGYSSALVTEITAGITNNRTCDPNCPTLDELRAALSTAQPNVALMHFGTNDVWNGIAAGEIIAAYDQVLGALREAEPSIILLVAQIIPMDVTDGTCSGCSCPGCPSGVQSLNEAITAWASDVTTADSPVIVVDQWSGFSASAGQDTGDGVHPNAAGSVKMADRWFEALDALL